MPRSDALPSQICVGPLPVDGALAERYGPRAYHVINNVRVKFVTTVMFMTDGST